MAENDQIDDSIVPDPLDPGDEFTLPETTDDEQTPEDPDAALSPDCNDEPEESA
jgi:hypothetical protein